MFKNFVIFRISPNFKYIAPENLDPLRFVECLPSQDRSIGWVPPRGQDHKALVERIGTHALLRLAVETKSVPSRIINRDAQERAKAIEANEGRKPGRKEMKEIREVIRFGLLPHAFPTLSMSWVWIDTKSNLLVIEAGSETRTDEAVVLLNKSIEGLGMQRVQTVQSPAACMAGWLADIYSPRDFTIDRDTELKARDDTGAKVRYASHSLDNEEVRKHLEGGKVPTRLAMTWSDRVSFVMTDKFAIKRVKFLEGVFENQTPAKDEDEQFDADVTITTAELSRLIFDLLEAMGGEQI